jgi:hypothetical protein
MKVLGPYPYPFSAKIKPEKPPDSPHDQSNHTAVTLHIGTENGRKSSREILRAHGITSPNTKAPNGVREPIRGFFHTPFWLTFS